MPVWSLAENSPGSKIALPSSGNAHRIGSVARDRDRFARLLVVGTPADVVTVCWGALPRSVFASLAAIETRGGGRRLATRPASRRAVAGTCRMVVLA